MKGKRILYVLTSESLVTSVGKKVRAQVEALNSLGYDCKGLYVTFDPEPENKPDHIIWQTVALEHHKYFRELKYLNALRNKAVEYLFAQQEEYDLFYIRHCGSHRSLLQWMKKQGKRTVIEIQGDGFGEIVATLSNLKGSIAARTFGFLQYFVFPYINELMFLRRCLSKATQVVTVTEELNKRLSKYNTHVHTMANGYDAEKMNVRPAPEFTGEALRLIFLKGNSMELGYDGLDRILHSIDISPLRNMFRFIVLGNLSEFEKREIDRYNFAEYKGFLSGDALEAEINNAHGGISTMALFRINKLEASALKLREYFAKGVPVIYGYTDSDISRHAELQKFCLQFPNDNSPLDMQRIFNFVQDFYNQPNRISEMVESAKKYLSWKQKMRVTMEAVFNTLDSNKEGPSAAGPRGSEDFGG